MNTEVREGRYPGKFGRIVLSALEEVVGRDGLLALLRLARLEDWAQEIEDDFRPTVTFEAVGRLSAALDELYGPTEGQWLARQVGHRAFRLGAEGLGFALGLADVGRRLLPPAVKIRLGMETLAEFFNRYSDQRVRLGEDNDFYYWIAESGGFCYGRRTTYPACGMATGLLSATLSWMRGGAGVEVQEVECRAQGAPHCTFRIPKGKAGQRQHNA